MEFTLVQKSQPSPLSTKSFQPVLRALGVALVGLTLAGCDPTPEPLPIVEPKKRRPPPPPPAPPTEAIKFQVEEVRSQYTLVSSAAVQLSGLANHQLRFLTPESPNIDGGEMDKIRQAMKTLQERITRLEQVSASLVTNPVSIVGTNNYTAQQ